MAERARRGAKIEIVGLDIFGWGSAQALVFVRFQRHRQRRGNTARNLILDLEDILELPVVTLGPQVVIGSGVDELAAPQ